MRLRTLGFIVNLTLGLLAAPLTGGAQQPAKVFRIGILGTYPPTTPELAHLWEAFIQGLREPGYVEGQNITIERRFMEGKAERLPELAAELVRLNVSVIVAGSQPPPVAAKRATATIPIVMTNFSDPVELGLVTSLARPGANVTGTTITPTPEIFGKNLELLKEAVPQASRVAVLWNPAEPAQLVLREVDVAARLLGVELRRVEARGPEEFDRAFSAMAQERADALLVLGGGPFLVHRTRLAGLAVKYRLPTMYILREYVEAGGLMSYAVNMTDFVGRAAVYVDKILKGAKPADLPVEQPTKFELIINMKTAKALGLTIPPSVLIRADEVIQ